MPPHPCLVNCTSPLASLLFVCVAPTSSGASCGHGAKSPTGAALRFGAISCVRLPAVRGSRCVTRRPHSLSFPVHGVSLIVAPKAAVRRFPPLPAFARFFFYRKRYATMSLPFHSDGRGAVARGFKQGLNRRIISVFARFQGAPVVYV